MGTCESRHCLVSIEVDKVIGASFKRLSPDDAVGRGDVRGVVGVNSGGDSSLRFVKHIKGEYHTNFWRILSSRLAYHSN